MIGVFARRTAGLAWVGLAVITVGLPVLAGADTPPASKLVSAFAHPDPADAFLLIYESRDERRRTIKGREPSVALTTIALTANVSKRPDGVMQLALVRLLYHPDHRPADESPTALPGHRLELTAEDSGLVLRFVAADGAPALPKALKSWLRKTFARGLPALVDARLLEATKGEQSLAEDEARSLLGLPKDEGSSELRVKRSATAEPKPKVSLSGELKLARLGDLAFRGPGRMTLKVRASAEAVKPGAPCEVKVSRVVTGTLTVEGVSVEREVEVSLRREHRWQRKPLDRAPMPRRDSGDPPADD